MIFLLPFISLGQTTESVGFQCFSEGASNNSSAVPTGCNINADCNNTQGLPYAYINVNFHFIGSSIGNLEPDDPTTSSDDLLLTNGNRSAELILDNVNARLANLQQGTLTTNSFIGDSKIRLNLHTEASNLDDEYGGVWYWENQAEYNSAIIDGSLNLYQGKVANIEFTEDEADPSCNSAGAAITITDGIEVMHYKYAVLECPDDDDDIVHRAAGTIMHEFFHDFGLSHSFSCAANGNTCADVDLNVPEECASDDADIFCEPDFGDNSAVCNPFTNSVSRNIMGYNYTQNVLSCCQWENMYSFVYSMNLPYVSFRATDHEDNCIITQQPLYLNTLGTIEWNTIQTLNRSVIIETGTTLKVNCNVYMAEQAKIDVRPGARLIVNNAEITSICKDREWGGIEVNGNADKAHQPYMLNEAIPLLPDDPGVAILQESTISNAGTAVKVARTGIDYETQLAQRGGLVYADETEFINNRRAVAFLKHDHLNLSKFVECVFKSDRGTRAVTIWDCENIHFEACNFLDLGNLNGDGTSGAVDVGITLLDGGMIVENNCKFSDLTIGIDCVNTVPLIFPDDVFIGSFDNDVQRNEFKNNSRHIQAAGMNDILIQRNVFKERKLGGLQGQNDFTGGVRVFDKSNFTVHKNDFSPTNLYVSRNENRIGKIEYNSFTSTELWGAIFVLGDSRATNFNFNCFFNETAGDVQYLNNSDTYSTLNQVHGNEQVPYFNAFSENHAANKDIFIPNFLPEMFYFYHPYAETENPALIPRCGLTDNTTVCSSIRNFTAEPINDPEPDSYYEDLRPCLAIIPDKPEDPKCTKLSCLDDLRAEIKDSKDKIDNGNTDYLVNLIASSPNSFLTQQALEEATPFLSDVVLKALIESNQMSENLKETILTNNAPLSAKASELVMGNLNSDFISQLELINGAEPFSARQLLEIEIYTLEYDYAYSFETRIKHLSKANDYASLEETLIADGTLDSQRRLLGLEFRKKDFVAAQAVLDNLPEETIDDVLFKAVQSINLDFLSAEAPFTLSSQQESLLYQAAGENHQSSTYARGLLMLLKGENFLVNESLSTDMDSQQSIAPSGTSSQNSLNFEELTIFPNPAKQEITVQIPDNLDYSPNSSIKIINTNGILIQVLNLNEGDNKIKVNITDLPNGLYFTGLWQNEALISFKRLIVSK